MLNSASLCAPQEWSAGLYFSFRSRETPTSSAMFVISRAQSMALQRETWNAKNRWTMKQDVLVDWAALRSKYTAIKLKQEHDDNHQSIPTRTRQDGIPDSHAGQQEFVIHVFVNVGWWFLQWCLILQLKVNWTLWRFARHVMALEWRRCFITTW